MRFLARNSDDELVRALKKRDRYHGVSEEEEHRQILRDALRADDAEKRKTFWQVLSDMPDVGDDTFFESERVV